MKIKVGDVFELSVEGKTRYIQVTHIHPMFGTLVRVIHGSWDAPVDLETLVNTSTDYVCFLRLNKEALSNFVKYCGSISIPLDAQNFPVFRSGMSGRDKKVHVWWLWDGTTSEKIGSLSPEQRDLPIRGIWNYHLLARRLKEDWSPKTDLR